MPLLVVFCEKSSRLTTPDVNLSDVINTLNNVIVTQEEVYGSTLFVIRIYGNRPRHH